MKASYISCHECDQICKVSINGAKGRLKCPVCDNVLYKHNENMIENMFALSLSALILFIVVIIFPFMSFTIPGNTSNATFTSSIIYMFSDKQWMMGTIILITTVIVPFSRIILYLTLFGPLYFKKVPYYAANSIKLLQKLMPWGMLDVFLIGILVSVVKLVKMGTIHTGVSLWAFFILVFVFSAMEIQFDAHPIWDKIDENQKGKL
jgi:paraquat-inducible protein A